MRYALISDIHGNLPSLEAVLRDASQLNIDKYLFVGDYYGELPFPNEIVKIIKDSPYVIRGNREDYLVSLSRQDQSLWLFDQYAALYWNYRELNNSHLTYLMNLPFEMIIQEEDGAYIHMVHSADHLFKNTRIEEFNTERFTYEMKSHPSDRQKKVEEFKRDLLNDKRLHKRMGELPRGVYVFGHIHIQWCLQLGESLFINPGSCGAPLDFDCKAPYTIIEHSSKGWSFEERRVEYDRNLVVNNLKSSSLYSKAPIWSELFIQELTTGTSAIQEFLCHAEKISQEMNETGRPFSNQVWDKAAISWFSKDK